MKKILIFGNSGSGKSTLAIKLCERHKLAHLDLDTLAWQNTSPAERKPLKECENEIFSFISMSKGWVIEGCYTDLLELVEHHSSEIIFIKLPMEECISNAKNRPWEPHKYESKQAQDSNLDMLIGWISQYESRVDTFSKNSHQNFYDHYMGTKKCIYSNEYSNSLLA